MSKKIEQITIRELGSLMAKGKQAGYITYDELNKHLPGELVSADRVEQSDQYLHRNGY